jgi:hypothetical protein
VRSKNGTYLTLNDHDASPGFKFVAVLPHAREIGLLGSADEVYWADLLRGQDLSPLERDGRASVLISAIESRFLGFRFRELCISVLVGRDVGGARQDGFYLAAAWNSSRYFAAVERAFFSTPYRHGNVCVDVRVPASLGLVGEAVVVFRAEMFAPSDAVAREPARSGVAGWHGPIFLPRDKPGASAGGKWFYARVGGDTRVFPFAPARDTVSFNTPDDQPAFRWLIESGFLGREWVIREDANHARTKTFSGTPASVPFSA